MVRFLGARMDGSRSAAVGWYNARLEKRTGTKEEDGRE